MARVILRQEAIDDLNDIWDYTFENWSETQADKYYSSVKLACNQIGQNPELGRIYNYVNENILGLKVGRHIIFYHLISNDEVEIIRTLHERMDLENRLDE
ncbi:MAG: type II toxin-antitoxin system RelE/ParE family toxin [Bacteroidetes bacterium]|jgi:toxin ParE1/3/4|nr:type II toxin-antitoxin system RelE/ParE family toxin [Bacteroidota bacterium]